MYAGIVGGGRGRFDWLAKQCCYQLWIVQTGEAKSWLGITQAVSTPNAKAEAYGTEIGLFHNIPDYIRIALSVMSNMHAQYSWAVDSIKNAGTNSISSSLAVNSIVSVPTLAKSLETLNTTRGSALLL